MAVTTTWLAEQVERLMGVTIFGTIGASAHKWESNAALLNSDDIKYYALAMLCVTEGVDVIGTRDTTDVIVAQSGRHRGQYCTRDKLVRTILSEYVKMKRGE